MRKAAKPAADSPPARTVDLEVQQTRKPIDTRAIFLPPIGPYIFCLFFIGPFGQLIAILLKAQHRHPVAARIGNPADSHPNDGSNAGLRRAMTHEFFEAGILRFQHRPSSI